MRQALDTATTALLLILMATTGGVALAADDGNVSITSLQVGFDGSFKLGCWTEVQVEVQGGEAPYSGVVHITTPDPEGVPATVIAPDPVRVEPGETTVVRTYVRPGQDGGPLTVRFVDEHGDERGVRRFQPGSEPGEGYFPAGRPAGNRLIVSAGSPLDLRELSRDEPADDKLHATHVAHVADSGDLPTKWYGYEGVEHLILSTSRAEQFRGLNPNDPQIVAIAQWVEHGGRVTIFCCEKGVGAIGAEGALSSLVPGRFDAVVPLRESLPLETFSGGSSTAINAGQQFQMQVPRLVEVKGRILAFAGPEPEDLPLVVRTRRGLGEITFVAVDPASEPLAQWTGRAHLLRQAMQWPAASPVVGAPTSAFSQHEDLTDRLRRALDGSFAGVSTIPFGWVAVLVLAYIAIIGPGDYFFLKRFVRRMELTWLTFPLAVVAISAAAYWAAYSAKGNQLRVNQVEVVDVDQSSGVAYGAVWTHYFSPRVARRDLELTPRFAGATITADSERLVGLIGSTSFGLDGMEDRGGAPGPIDRGYRYSAGLDALQGLPAEQWSTRTLTARWSAKVDAKIEANLTELNEGLLAGHIANRTGAKLEDCILMHRNWAYLLPALPVGAGATIDDDLQPRHVRTALTLGASARGETVPRLDPLGATVPQIVQTMMFYEAMGGIAYAQSPSRYQSFLDLSDLVRGDQAILLARAAGVDGSPWTTDAGPLASDEDRHWVFYRFIIPLNPKPRMLP